MSKTRTKTKTPKKPATAVECVDRCIPTIGERLEATRQLIALARGVFKRADGYDDIEIDGDVAHALREGLTQAYDDLYWCLEVKGEWRRQSAPDGDQEWAMDDARNTDGAR